MEPVSIVKDAEMNDQDKVDDPFLEPCFIKLGKAWQENASAPLLVLVGFDLNWQRSSIIAHKSDCRLLHIRRDHEWSLIEAALDRVEKFEILVWRDKIDRNARLYAAKRGIPLQRVDLGVFPVVATKGSDRIAMTLAFDAVKGSVEDAKHSSLISILSSVDFDADPELRQIACSLVHAFRNLHLSFSPIYGKLATDASARMKQGESVVVIGQSEDYLQEKNYTNLRLLRRAIKENPGKKIFYYQEPGGTAGIKELLEEFKRDNIAIIPLRSPPVFGEVFEGIERVCVFDSILGLDALVYGIPVAAFGRPFFGGWGLTSGRKITPKRVLTIEQIFSAIFLHHQSYIGDEANVATNCLASMLRYAAERYILSESRTAPGDELAHATRLSKNSAWPITFSTLGVKAISGNPRTEKFFTDIDPKLILRGSTSLIYRKTFSAMVLGRTLQDYKQALPVRKVLMALEDAGVEAFLQEMWKIKRSVNLLEIAGSIHHMRGEYNEALDLFRAAAEFKDDESGKRDETSIRHPSFLVRSAELQFEMRRMDDAETNLLLALLYGVEDQVILPLLARIAFLRQDFEGSRDILKACERMSPLYRKGRNLSSLIVSQMLCGEAYSALQNIAVTSTLRESIGSHDIGMLEKMRVFGEGVSLDLVQAMYCVADVFDATSTGIAKAMSYVRNEQPEKAVANLRSYAPKSQETINYLCTLSQALSYSGQIEEAVQLLKPLVAEQIDETLINEAMRVAIFSNEFEWADEVFRHAKSKNITLRPEYQIHLFLSQGRIQDGYSMYKTTSQKPVLRALFGERYVDSLELLDRAPSKVNTLLASAGPGDEVRFSSLYGRIAEEIGRDGLRITCDPRLMSLLQRSFPQLRFVVVSRNRDIGAAVKSGRFDRLPSIELHSIIDNAGWDLVQQSDKVTLVTDLLGDMLEGRQSFSGEAVLRADMARADDFRGKIANFSNGRPVIGLSWRSSLQKFTRNVHYLDVEQLAPLLEIEGICFVNLQYDDCSEDLAWAEKHYPGKILNFADLDQFNDLDGVAALMAAVDTVISPCTIVIEMAGALGRPGYFLSNSPAILWREREGSRQDIWFRSISHVRGKKMGNKISLVEQLVEAVERDFLHNPTRAD